MHSAMIKLCILLAIGFASGYHTGAPDQACESMTPGHGPPPQTGKSPYRIILPKLESNGEPLEILLTAATSGPPFKGFFIQVRQKGGSNPVGEFNPNSDPSLAQSVSCGGMKNVAMTHKDNSEKTHVKLQWNPPPGASGEYEPIVTFVKQQDTFWVKETPDKGFRITSSGREGSSSKDAKDNSSSSEQSDNAAASSLVPFCSGILITSLVALMVHLRF